MDPPTIASSEFDPSSHHDLDRVRLARLGKQQVLKRNFGFMSMLGFSCTIMVTWEGMLVVFIQGFSNGGPAGLVYGFIVVWIGTMIVFTTLGELVSMAPTAGGQYYWVALLAPPRWRRFLSYLTGWTTVTGWQALAASGGYLVGTQIQGLIVLNHPDYDAKGWHGTLLFWAIIFVAVSINTFVSAALPQIEGMILVLHVLGFFGVMIPIVYLAPKGSAHEVFTTLMNEGSWPTQGLSFFVGIIGMVFAFLGTDGAIHMCEEIQNAAVIVPRSMITSVILNGCLGFGMLIAVLFSLGDIEQILQTPPLQYPFMVIIQQATRSLAGSSVMIAVIIVLGVCATIAFVASSSRMYWAFARDHGLPFSGFFSTIHPTSSIPLYTIALTTVVSCLLALINIGSSVAFNDIISLTICGLFSSYLICAVLLLWRRATNSIGVPSLDQDFSIGGDSDDDFNVHNLVWGPFHVPGVLGIITNVLAIIFLIIMLFFSFWPPAVKPTASTMNYSVLVYGAVLIFSTIYYFIYAKRHFIGPLRELPPLEKPRGITSMEMGPYKSPRL